jgi:PAS domain S-box-containing protein
VARWLWCLMLVSWLCVPLAASGASGPLVFLGDRDLPPYEFIEHGEPKGANVDLVRAIGRVLGRPVEVHLLDRAEAHARFRRGEGDALTLFGRTDVRAESFAFSQPTFPASFALFVRTDAASRVSYKRLEGMRIGVVQGGLSREYLERNHPEAILVVISSVGDGMRRLLRGEIDAYAASTWTGLFFLNELDLTSIRPMPPFMERNLNIALRRDDAVLLGDIDHALSELKASGEFFRIIDRWSYTKVHLFSRSTVQWAGVAASVAAVALLLLFAALLHLRRQKRALTREMAERTHAERELRSSDERFHIAARATNDAIWDWDVGADSVWWNEGAQTLFGYSKAQVGTEFGWWRQHLHPEDASRVIQGLHAAVAGSGSWWRDEYRFRRADGSYAHILDRGHVIRDAAGKAVRMLGAMQDLTARKAAETALRESEATLNAVLDALPVAVLIAERSGKIVRHNAAAVELWAEVPETDSLDEYGKWAGYWPDTGKRIQAQEWAMARALREGQVVRDELLEIERFGTSERRSLLNNAAPVRGADGRIIGAVVVQLDVTERLAVERQAAEAMREVERRKDEFLAMLAQELRNPLAPIKTAMAVLSRKVPLDAEFAWSRNVIDRQVDRMSRLIDDLLDVARIADGKLQVQKRRMALETIIDMALETSKPLIDAARHRLAVVLPPGAVFVDADAARLAQAFSNLLNNAARDTEPGGSIALTAAIDGPDVVVSVEDSGRGFAPEAAPQLFELFSRWTSPGAAKHAGLGLGLTLVQAIVALHGGTVEARSAGEGKGSEFSVRLPLAGAPEVAAPQGLAAVKPRHAGSIMRVLVVDDHVDVAEGLERFLATFGHEVRVAHDAPSALRIAGEFRPHAALLDIDLPGMDGYALAAALRERFGEAIRLVALTGLGQDGGQRRALEAGFNHHLTKPFHPEALNEVLVALVAEDRAPPNESTSAAS